MAPGLLNIQRDNPDQFYRYRMEALQTKIEGKGNGIKTVVINLPSVAESLERPRKWVIKYFGIELGATTPEDKKNDRWIINGAHEAAKLQDLLDGFIKRFVLCPACSNPETKFELEATGRDSFKFDCKACGRQSPVVTTHKLVGFIAKDLTEERNRKKLADKAAKRAAKKAKQNGTADDGADEAGENGSADGDGAEGDTGSPQNDAPGGDDPELAKLRAEVARVEIAEDEDKPVVWATDMSKESVETRQAAANSSLQKLDEEGPSVFDEFGDWVKERADALGGLDKLSSQEIEDKAEELNILERTKFVQVLVQAIFNADIIKQFPKRASLLQKIIGNDERKQKGLLGGTERLLGTLSVKNPEILEQTSVLLSMYYNSDLIEEEIVTAWGNSASKKYTDLETSRKVRKSAAGFFKWLEQDSESDESDDE